MQYFPYETLKNGNNSFGIHLNTGTITHLDDHDNSDDLFDKNNKKIIKKYYYRFGLNRDVTKFPFKDINTHYHVIPKKLNNHIIDIHFDTNKLIMNLKVDNTYIDKDKNGKKTEIKVDNYDKGWVFWCAIWCNPRSNYGSKWKLIEFNHTN